MNITSEMVTLFLAVMGAVGASWWRWNASIGKVRDDLAEHKTHVAEVYVTRAGMHEQTAQIMKAIDNVGERIDGVNQRLDRLYEAKPTRRTG